MVSRGYDDFGNLAWTVDAVGTKYEFAYTARNKVAEVRLRAWHGDPIGPGGPGGDGDGDTTVRDRSGTPRPDPGCWPGSAPTGQP